MQSLGGQEWYIKKNPRKSQIIWTIITYQSAFVSVSVEALFRRDASNKLNNLVKVYM